MVPTKMAWSFLVLLLFVVAGCPGYKPCMTPSKSEMIINEGDELVINCTSRSAFKIIFPETQPDGYIKTSERDMRYDENRITGFVKRTLQRKSTVHGDTGWYGCVDESVVEIHEGNFSDTNASWIYIYVKSKEHLFAPELEAQPILAFAGDNVLLRCRPTSPELHVDLTFNFMPVEMNDKISFDPRNGFTLQNMTTTDTGIYTCLVKTVDVEADPVELHINVIVQLKKFITKDAVIFEENLRHVTKGSELNITCTAEVNVDERYFFAWTTPRETAVNKVYALAPRKINEHILLVTSVLNIQNVTHNDEGEYVCQVRTDLKSTRTQTYINIYDPESQHRH